MNERPDIGATGSALHPTFGTDIANASILVIDDEEGMRHFLNKSLGRHCRSVAVTASVKEASELLDERTFDIIILDNIMPGLTGLEWLAEQRKIGLNSDVILMTAYADLDTAINAIRLGASDFLLKPFHSNQVLNAISKSLAKTGLIRENSLLRRELAEGRDLLRQRDTLIGTSDKAKAVRDKIKSAAAIDAHVVIHGETGTGRQVSARMLHNESARRHRAFAWLPCFGITPEDFKERLFGRLRSTGDTDDGVEGILHTAEGGTLFLDDVEMLSASCQNTLVEWLNASRFQPIGGGRTFQSDIRVVCCCSRPLQQAVEEKVFRPDLFYMLNVHEIRMPPLRERATDIADLAEFFLQTLSLRMGVAAPEFTAQIKRRFMAYDWPGNVMELRNVVERAIIQGRFDDELSKHISAPTQSLAEVEQRHILSVLQACGGNRAETARQLGVARKTIDRKCQSWGI
jgi:DNA-binding NtrC family response regulator